MPFHTKSERKKRIQKILKGAGRFLKKAEKTFQGTARNLVTGIQRLRDPNVKKGAAGFRRAREGQRGATARFTNKRKRGKQALRVFKLLRGKK